MTAIFQLVVLLAILLIAIGTGWSFTVTKTQDELDCYSCDGEDSTVRGWGWRPWGKASPAPAVWQQIYQLFKDDSGTVCGTENGSWLNYNSLTNLVKTKREKGIVTTSYCALNRYFIKGEILKSVGLGTPKEDTGWEVFEVYERWKEKLKSEVSKLPRPDLTPAWQEIKKRADKLCEHIQNIVKKIPQGSSNAGFWNAVLGVFFIWRMIVAFSSKHEIIEAVSNSVQPQKGPSALTLAIGRKFVALKVIGTTKNFHMFHLLSKLTQDNVFMKCLRSNATRAAKIGLAREFRVLGTISHPNVILWGGWMRAGAACSLSLEWAKYGNLPQAVTSHVSTFKLADKMAVFRQVVRAVSYLHQSKVAHLNIRSKSILVFSKWSLVKLSGFSRSVRVTRKRLCNRFDLHPSAVPADVVIRRELYDPLKVDCWALGALLLYLLTGDHHGRGSKSSKPMIEALEDYNMKCKKIILTLISRLMSSDPRARPDPPDILRFLNGIDK